ncbi:hypothetical protein Tco_0885361 [Tanacetum coccineum]
MSCLDNVTPSLASSLSKIHDPVFLDKMIMMLLRHSSLLTTLLSSGVHWASGLMAPSANLWLKEPSYNTLNVTQAEHLEGSDGGLEHLGVGMVGGGAIGGVTNGVVMGEVSGVCGDVSSGVVGAVALEALVMFEGDLRTEFYKFSSKEEDGECKQKVIIIGRKAKIRPKYAYVIPDQPDLLKRDPPFVAKGSGCLEQKYPPGAITTPTLPYQKDKQSPSGLSPQNPTHPRLLVNDDDDEDGCNDIVVVAAGGSVWRSRVRESVVGDRIDREMGVFLVLAGNARLENVPRCGGGSPACRIFGREKGEL